MNGSSANCFLTVLQLQIKLKSQQSFQSICLMLCLHSKWKESLQIWDQGLQCLHVCKSTIRLSELVSVSDFKGLSKGFGIQPQGAHGSSQGLSPPHDSSKFTNKSCFILFQTLSTAIAFGIRCVVVAWIPGCACSPQYRIVRSPQPCVDYRIESSCTGI